MRNELKRQSYVITDGPDRAAARAMLMFGDDGLTPEDLDKPIVGVANTWIEIGPCNYHLRRLAAKVKEGIRAAGGTPLEFNTVSISDGISMGTEGMKASLISREVIADSIELVCRGNMFDAVVTLCGCGQNRARYSDGTCPFGHTLIDALRRINYARPFSGGRCDNYGGFRGGGGARRRQNHYRRA